MPIPAGPTIRNELIALIRERGVLSTSEAYEALAAAWDLSAAEREEVLGGTRRYRLKIRWARQDLVREGVIETKGKAGRGVWRLTEAFLARQTEAGSRPAFTPGHRARARTALVRARTETDQAVLRHNLLVERLYEELARDHGLDSVGTEQPSGIGGFVDVVLRLGPDRYWIYEVKVAETASEAIRQSLGQLLEYGYREGAWDPEKLIVVGEPTLDKASDRFLKRLSEKFRLPLEYRQIVIA